MTRRADRVADEIRQALARILQAEMRDPRVGFVTLTDVELSPDLRHARVFVSFIGADADPALRVLRRAAPFLRRSLAREAGLRFTPELRFEIDASIDGGFRVDRILDEISEQRDDLPDEEPS